MIRYLVVFDRRRGTVIELRSIASEDASIADIRLEAEDAYTNNADVEVVVLTSDSEAGLRQTHARYFENVGALADRALTELD